MKPQNISCLFCGFTIIDAFAEVVEYKPFARYKEPTGMVTTEWDKVNPDGRYRELQAESKPELTRLK